MKGALVTFIAKVEGVVKEKFSGAPPQASTQHLLPIKIPGGATAFTLPRFCKKMEKKYPFLGNRSHYSAQKRRFSKRSSKWIFTKTEAFENAVDQCERTKTDKNKNAATATAKYFTIFSPNSTLNLKKAKTYEMEYIKFCRFS